MRTYARTGNWFLEDHLVIAPATRKRYCEGSLKRAPLTSRCCSEPRFLEGSLVCRTCAATLGQMESDLTAQGSLFAEVVAHIQKLVTPPEVKVERVRIAEFFSGAVENEEHVKQAIARLQDHLLKLPMRE